MVYVTLYAKVNQHHFILTQAIKSPKDASLNPPANTQNKKPSVVSTNKPNCNVTKEAKSPKDENVPETKDVENLEVKKDETKVPKREKTPDIISGAVIQKPEDEMKPQVMVNEEDESSNGTTEEVQKEVEEIADNTVSEEKPIDVGDDNDTKPELNEEELPSQEQTSAKHIISSEEEAKARLAEKRRLMKEKMEREAELERQRLVTTSFRFSTYYEEKCIIILSI